MTTDKRATMREAIGRLVPDGASVALGTFMEQRIPFSAGHEIIRQKKRDLTLVGPISDILFDQLIGAGCAARVQAAWVGNVMMGSAYNFRRAVEEGVPRSIEVVDYSNYTLSLALEAAGRGVPFLPTRSTSGTDLAARNPGFRRIEDPWTGAPLLAIGALAPDVAILPVQRSDASGNAHVWGNLGVSIEAAHAAKTVIAVAEEIVPEEEIRSDPNRTLLPGLLVSAVVHEPWGSHPSPCVGYYNRDNEYFREYHAGTKTRAGFEAWLDRWVTGVPDRAAYLEILGRERIEGLRIRERAPGLAVDYGV